jgi:hypothetical protein
MFVQMIEFRTSKIDEMKKLADEMLAQRGADWTARRGIIGEDRDNPGRYFQIVFFDSHESAMRNSELPLTQRLSEQMGALGDGPPAFYNLDVVDDRTF